MQTANILKEAKVTCKINCVNSALWLFKNFLNILAENIDEIITSVSFCNYLTNSMTSWMCLQNRTLN